MLGQWDTSPWEAFRASSLIEKLAIVLQLLALVFAVFGGNLIAAALLIPALVTMYRLGRVRAVLASEYGNYEDGPQHAPPDDYEPRQAEQPRGGNLGDFR